MLRDQENTDCPSKPQSPFPHEGEGRGKGSIIFKYFTRPCLEIAKLEPGGKGEGNITAGLEKLKTQADFWGLWG